jgi:hypothetical protein
MEKEFIPYEQAVALKELGFDEPCIAFYTQNAYGDGKELQWFRKPNDCNSDYVFISAPIYQQAFRWFREKCGFDLTIQHNKKYIAIVYSSVKNFSIDEYDTYEEAELECLKKLIEIVKEK